MNITGIITEYNPLHFGHKFHIDSSKTISSCDGIICVMSGNFVQRGLPAFTDKWTRAEMALNAGVDLVIELPTLFATSSAEFFAFGAVSLLNSLNVVDNLPPGSECGDINLILCISEILSSEPQSFKDFLKKELSNGLPFAKARSNALFSYMSNIGIDIDDVSLQNLLNSSNNILAIEYCKTLFKLNSSIKPFTIKREGSNYNETSIYKNSFNSASAIRKSFYDTKSLENIRPHVPCYVFDLLKEKGSFSDIDKMYSFIKYNILAFPNLLKTIPEAREGLDNKIINTLPFCNSLDDFIIACKSKRYSYTRISRILCQSFLGITSDLLNLRKTPPNYLRVLGLNKKGAEILKEIKKNSYITIINKVPKKNVDPLLALDIKATNLYSLINDSSKVNADFLSSPIILK